MAKLFRENNIEFEQVNYFNAPLTEEKLHDLLKKANLSAFDIIRKSETVYKELRISEISDENELIKLIVENPALLQRPIVEVGDRAVLARPVEKVFELFKL